MIGDTAVCDTEWMRQATFRKDRCNVEQMQKAMTEVGGMSRGCFAVGHREPGWFI